MKWTRTHMMALVATVAALSCLLPQTARAQVQKEKAPVFLHYKVENGDTVYVETLKPVYKWGNSRRGKGDWKKYCRLVYNFNKTYPYALAADKLIADTDSTFQADALGRRKKEKYVNALQKKLFAAYEKPLKNMTVTQGQLLMKLIDREVGMSSYSIIKEYKSGLTAGFWQGIAKLFGSDLKKPYDPEGEDKATEDLVRKWNRGEFPNFYFSIFGEYPTVPAELSKTM